MLDFIRKYPQWIFLSVLVFANVLVWHAGAAPARSGKLTLAFLNIGQGDSIYIESPTGNRVLVDGGPDSSLLRELGAVMPFGSRTVDMIAVTNPDKDHYVGFLDLLDRYHVGAELEPGTLPGTPEYALLESKLKEKKVSQIVARGGQVYDLGGGAMLYVLFPDRDITNWSTNEGSLVMKLVYGKTSVYLSGDSPQNIEKYLVGKYGTALADPEEILKAGHHGSRTSTSPELVADLKPEYAVISAGAGNRYGHPHKEMLGVLAAANVPALITFKEGRIIFESDGERFLRK